MLPGRIAAPVNGAFVSIATVAFQKQFHAFATALPADSTCIPCHFSLNTSNLTPDAVSAAGNRYGELE
jgi:hypothetical protein